MNAARAIEGVTLRHGTEGDLAAIGRLFTPAKSPSLVRWLLSGASGQEGLASFLAIADGEVVGHVGYTRSTFTDGDRVFTGVYPILWKVRDNVTGAVGLQLLSRVLRFGDFSYIIGGSAEARRLYRGLGYRPLFELSTFRKVVNLKGIGSRLLSRQGARAVKMRSRAVLSTLRPRALEPATQDHAQSRKLDGCRRVWNMSAEAQFAWAAACPEVETHVMRLPLDRTRTATVLCYVKRPERRPVSGTIVHIAPADLDASVWLEALTRAEAFLTEQGCSQITLAASDAAMQRALQRTGYVVDRRLPFWFRGRSEPSLEWHLTLLEGDLGYRK